ncbi:MAG: class I SAM-dependent DNA methyltransferase [Proteobacteria bacterium]|nr:class I SAM-dependent DNA methyltransferase [Pseudomonadota bacterium]
MTVGKNKAESFIDRWGASGGGERSNYQMFLTELCDLIDVPKPDPAVEDESKNAYVFERKVPARRLEGPTTSNFIDLYKRGCFVLEAKQSAKRLKQLAELKQLGLELPEQRTGSGRRGGAQWDTVMRQAREQAEIYAKRLPPEEGWPPFLVIVDIGHVIELYADFSLQGKHYAQFPDRQSFRVYLEDLCDENVRERLRLVWTDPQVLNPARRTAEVTREVAELLAKLSKSLETRLIRALPDKRRPEQLSADRRAIAEKVALFLMRCLFTMFAEDVGLLKRDSFTGLLKEYKGQADKVHFPLERLWKDMNAGGFSPELRTDVLKFNGGLFKDSSALEITEDDLTLLAIAAERDWKDVEPAIFGTLLERALGPSDRHRLGAHYTPRAYVERLVAATVIEPLTEDWRNVQAAAAHFMESNEKKKAQDAVRGFHRELCQVCVLDPACGTGNFLYVSMELMKRLEGEVLETLIDLGVKQENLDLDRHTVDPHQFLGLEINPRAVAIAELVLWIGYLQWHFRTRGRTMPAEPVLKNFANIVEQDAVLKYDSWDVLRDETGKPISRWDGITYKLHPITGEEVPNEAARIELRRYLNPRPAEWPATDFIVGNPPFIGNKRMIKELGEGYTEAVRNAHPTVPKSVDFVMYWWDIAAVKVRAGNARRFGLITTNSVTQTFNRKIIAKHLSEKRNPLSLVFAVADHPWLKGTGKSAVRVALTVGVSGSTPGTLCRVVSEHGIETDTPNVELKGRDGKISSVLTVGTDLTLVKPLRANERLCWQGCKLVGTDFQIESNTRERFLRENPGLETNLPRYWAGRDITGKAKRRYVIDFFGLSQSAASEFKSAYQWVLDRVKPKRDHVRRKGHRERWWVFGEPRPALRASLANLERYIVTSEVSKHRFFTFLNWPNDLIDGSVIAIAHNDAWIFGIVSSLIHETWAVRIGGKMGVGNDPRYQNDQVFDPFPFPDPPEDVKARIRDLGERLDSLRKEVLEKHKQLTMTGLYNVLEKVRSGEALTDADRDVYEAGFVGVLKQIHDDLDAAIAEAYGWPADLSDEEVLERLVALNHERAAEEAVGNIRWLRPDFQTPKETPAVKRAEQIEAELIVTERKAKKPRFPAALPDQVAAIRAMLAVADGAVAATDLARCFAQGRRVEKRVEEVLRTLTLLGQAEQMDGRYILSN